MRHPDFFAGPAHGHLSTHKDEDTRLLKIIKEKWARAGYLIQAEVVEVGPATSKCSNALYGIRSNLINGLPIGNPVLVRP